MHREYSTNLALVISDDHVRRMLIATIVKRRGFLTEDVEGLGAAIDALEMRDYQAVILDECPAPPEDTSRLAGAFLAVIGTARLLFIADELRGAGGNVTSIRALLPARSFTVLNPAIDGKEVCGALKLLIEPESSGSDAPAERRRLRHA